MRRLRSRPFFALLLALCLLGVQTVANAHFAAHLGAATGATSQRHAGGESPVLDAACTMCAAYAILASAAPSRASVPAAVRQPFARPLARAPHFTPAPAAPPYASRAPPVFL